MESSVRPNVPPTRHPRQRRPLPQDPISLGQALAARAGSLDELIPVLAEAITRTIGGAGVVTLFSPDGYSVERMSVDRGPWQSPSSFDARAGAEGAGGASGDGLRRIVMPIMDGSQSVGELSAVRFDTETPYGQDELMMLDALAEAAAVAVRETRATGPTPRSSDADVSTIWGQSLDGILLLSADGEIEAANPAACGILGRTEASIRRRGVDALFVVDDPATRVLLDHTAAAGPVRGEVAMRRGDGSTFIAEAAVNVFDDAGRRRACMIFRDVTAQVSYRQRLELDAQSSNKDPLTGLYNRRGFAAAAGEALQVSDRQGVEAQLVFFDLDGLKSINDSYGHRAGDEALRRVATVLTTGCRGTDVSGRLGGDEFALLLFGADTATTAMVLRRIADRLADFGPDPHTEVSVGVATYTPGSGERLEDLIDRADHAMYEARALHRHATPPAPQG